jgi:hypothetical protein
MNTLHKIQNQFSVAVLSDDPLNANTNTDGFGIEEAILAGTLPGNRRLNIYRNNVKLSLRNALKAVYPVIHKLVGEEFFNAMANNYIVKHPSRSGNLHDFGNQLSNFISGFTPASELVYLPDVAKLEWAYHYVFHAKNGQAFDIEKLQQVDTANYGKLCFKLSPACQLVSSSYPIVRIWQANQDQTESPGAEINASNSISLDEGKTFLLVLRKGLDIEFQTLSPCEFNFLEALSQRNSFFVACDKASEAQPECDVGKLLQKHILSQTIIDFEVAD